MPVIHVVNIPGVPMLPNNGFAMKKTTIEEIGDL